MYEEKTIGARKAKWRRRFVDLFQTLLSIIDFRRDRAGRSTRGSFNTSVYAALAVVS
jgi:hypothetical protein